MCRPTACSQRGLVARSLRGVRFLPVPVASLATLVFSSLLLTAGEVRSEPIDSCGTDDSTPRSAVRVVPDSGSVNALFILARFADENTRSWNNGWPIDPAQTRRDVKPAWADSLLEAPDTTGAPPEVEGSITHFFHYMSQGKLDFRGSVYDSVIVLPNVASFQNNIVGAQRALADSLYEAGFQFSDFVNNHEGAVGEPDTLDYVGFVFRGWRRFGYCNPDSCGDLLATARVGADGETGHLEYVFADSSLAISPSLQQYATGVIDRVVLAEYPSSQPGTLDPAQCDSCEVPKIRLPVMAHSLEVYRQVLVHEIGHSVYQHSDFLIGGHIWSVGDWGIMKSKGRGSIMHAAARAELGWLNPIEVYPGTDATVRLYDTTIEGGPDFGSASRKDSTCCIIYPDSTDTSQYFVLENRRNSSVYAKSWVGQKRKLPL